MMTSLQANYSEGGGVRVGGAQARHDSHDGPLHHPAGLGHGGYLALALSALRPQISRPSGSSIAWPASLKCPVMASATALGRSSCGMCPASAMISTRA